MASDFLAGVPLAWSEQPGELPRRFSNRQALEAELQRRFPEAPGSLSPTRGGRHQAETLLNLIQPERYAKGRNFLNGPVTRLSPYIRHGVLTLAEVRDAVFARTRARQGSEKLINELGWRDYWQRLWQQLGTGIWRDQEALKTGHRAAAYADALPADIREGSTGLACMDDFIAELHHSGWLHNHARLWLAAYLVHWRRIRWQVGAQWFLRHLLDGDPASNNLSWQWVASSFSHKPYVFNRANLERYSNGSFCRSCERHQQGCPFEASYEELTAELFKPLPSSREQNTQELNSRELSNGGAKSLTFSRPILWIHGDGLGQANPALVAHPGQPALYVFDTELLAGRSPTTGDPTNKAEPVSLKRIGFLYECLLELPISLRQGDVAAEVLGFARSHGGDGIITSASVDPRMAAICQTLEQHLPVQVLAGEPFVQLDREPDLGRFSRYWRHAEAKVWAQWSPPQ